MRSLTVSFNPKNEGRKKVWFFLGKIWKRTRASLVSQVRFDFMDLSSCLLISTTSALNFVLEFSTEAGLFSRFPRRLTRLQKVFDTFTYKLQWIRLPTDSPKSDKKERSNKENNSVHVLSSRFYELIIRVQNNIEFPQFFWFSEKPSTQSKDIFCQV